MNADQNSGGISYRVEGDQEIIRVLGRIADPAQRTELMFNIGAYGVSSTQQRFLDQAAPDGQAWKPSIRARETGGQTLMASNRLMSSFNAHSTANTAMWGTNVKYARIHHEGGIIYPREKKALAFRLANGRFVIAKKVTIPARPYLGVDQKDRTRIMSIAKTWGEGLVTG